MTPRLFSHCAPALLLVMLAAPARGGEGEFDSDGTYKTNNFRVSAPTKDLAARFGDLAERYRREKAMDWLGKEMPPWNRRCPLKVEINLKQSGGATKFSFTGDGSGRSSVGSQEMEIWGETNQLLNSVLPHEVTHTVLAYHFGRPVPRWADEGGSVLSENEEECFTHDVRCREILNQGRAIQLRVIFTLKEYPRDMITVYAQGYSVSAFLINKGGRPKFLEFVGLGMRNDNRNWEAAVREIYAFGSVDELQEAWIESLKTPPQRTSARAKGTANLASRGSSEIRSSGAPGLPRLLDPAVARGAAPDDKPAARPTSRNTTAVAAPPRPLMLPPEPPAPPRK